VPVFGRFELQPERRRLLRDGEPVAMGARAFDVLLALLERGDRVVSKTELLDLVWPGLVVEENNLQVQISTLRKHLGTQAIVTVPGRGYRFTATIGIPAAPDIDDSKMSLQSSGTTHSVEPTARLTNLPAALSPLFGRIDELRELRELLSAHRLVSVVGAGGMGKSRLVQTTAHSLMRGWADGAWMVELAGLSDAALLPNVVAQALDIKLAGRAPLDELVAAISQRTLLLVLDNCEHLLEGAAALAQAILLGAPQVTLLTTSQEPLRLPAEQQFRLTPLSVPAAATTSAARGFGAVALLEARVRAVDSRFSLGDEVMDVAIDICRRLDGLPLAIELAAARVATLGLRPVRDKLDERFRLLTGGSRATLRRHQTLRAALEWSHNLLNDAEQAVFRRLAVFAGGFMMEMAQFVAGDAQLDEWAVLDHLSALVEKSLVVAGDGDVPRYRLLESARAFGLEQLAAAGETTETLKKHALAVRRHFERVDNVNLDGGLRTEQLEASLLPELDNLRAAHSWATAEGADVETAIVLAACSTSLDDFTIESGGWLPPLQRYVETGVAHAVAARYWRAIASANMYRRVPLALQADAADRARMLYLELGLPRRAFSSLVQLAHYRLLLGDSAASRAAADEARALLQPDWPVTLRVRLLRVDAYSARRDGRFAEALALSREVVRVSVSTGDWLLEVIARVDLVGLLWRTGPLEDAAREAYSLAEELRARPTAHLDMAELFYCMLGVLSEAGRIDEALAVADEAWLVMRRARNYFVAMWAHLFWRLGHAAAAAQLLGASDARSVRSGMSAGANDRRLSAEARTGLQTRLGPDALARALAEGAVLAEEEMLQVISAGLNASGVAVR
jgi:predicted ATPase/DNA-binding winged helix-turn-helix (wHTH) protein